ncbi:Sec-independent protein translocase protein TatB [Qipengyuania soli]|uniref:Sec-independent protein translocase protein TatB n=1 Tax=Qipengyuania soli TaxID=2782568 RepID=A0A7S8F5G3_9SPHN|nr:Sec-independent protein translocase protein TatB [Qipengyuania soli]QPC99358.1 twin-arginine translocase subunit TatB [Qipengyuania soli]
MFDIGASELLMIVIVAIVVIGPKDMPRALRSAGRWIGKVRRMSNHFRAGVDEMIRQAEIEDMEAKWAERNKQIMAKYPTGDEPAGGAPDDLLPPQMEPLDSAEADARAEAAIARAAPAKAPEHESEPPLPLAPPSGPKDA